MFWMFLINALGVLIGFGLAFYLLLITQKGGLFGKARASSSGFFCSFFAQLPSWRKPNDCSLWFARQNLHRAEKKSQISAIVRSPSRHLAGPWQEDRPRTERLFVLVPGNQPSCWKPSASRVNYCSLYGLGVGVGIGLRSRCSESERLPSLLFLLFSAVFPDF